MSYFDRPRQAYCECVINGERIRFDAQYSSGTVEQGNEFYKEGVNFKYIGSGNVCYYDGVKNEHKNIRHFYQKLF